MSSQRLSTLIKEQIIANISFANEIDSSLQDFSNAIAEAIYQYLQETGGVVAGSASLPIIANPDAPIEGSGLLYLDSNDGNNPKIITPDGSKIRLIWQED